MKQRILFVDEDQSVLDGFKRVLYKMRSKWDMDFASTSEQALEKMENGSFNAVVASLHMTGISGIQLFEILQESHPETARVFVSDSGEMKTLIEALGTAHQFLVKPVDPVILKNTILRVMALREYLQDNHLKAVINKIKSLPTQPEIHLELLQAISTESIREIGKIIEKNPSIAAKILQLVNSPFFGLKSHINSIFQAVALLGVDTLKALVLSLEIFSKFQVSGSLSKELDEIFSHSIDVASYARLIANEISHRREVANDAFMGGLLHDTGRLILLSCQTEIYYKIKYRYDHQPAAARLPLWQIENEILGVDHSKIGAYLLGLWGLPEIYVEVAAYHHTPTAYFSRQFSAVTAVHIADAIKHMETDDKESRVDFSLRLDLPHLDPLDLTSVVPSFITSINRLKELQPSDR